MNQTLKNFGTNKMVELLNQCTPPQQRMFKLMYGRDNGKRSVEDAEKLTIDEVVSMVAAERYSLALDQIERTIAKNQPV